MRPLIRASLIPRLPLWLDSILLDGLYCVLETRALSWYIQQVDAKTVREVCSRLVYDKCPVMVGIGEDSNSMKGFA